MKYSFTTIAFCIFFMLSAPHDVKASSYKLDGDTLSIGFTPISIGYDNNNKSDMRPGGLKRMPQHTHSLLSISGHTLRLSGEMAPGMVEIAMHEPDARSASLWETSVVMTGKTAYVELPEWLSGSYAIRLRTTDAAYIGTIDL